MSSLPAFVLKCLNESFKAVITTNGTFYLAAADDLLVNKEFNHSERNL